MSTAPPLRGEPLMVRMPALGALTLVQKFGTKGKVSGLPRHDPQGVPSWVIDCGPSVGILAGEVHRVPGWGMVHRSSRRGVVWTLAAQRQQQHQEGTKRDG